MVQSAQAASSPVEREGSTEEQLRTARELSRAPVYRASGFWRRVGAGLLDLLVVSIAALLFFAIISAVLDVSFPPNRKSGMEFWFDVDFWLELVINSDPALICWFVVFGLTLSVYLFLFQLLWGRTPGMHVLRIKVIDMYGDDPRPSVVARRLGGYWLGIFSLGLGYLWAAFDLEHRGLHDWLAGTYVIHNENAST